MKTVSSKRGNVAWIWRIFLIAIVVIVIMLSTGKLLNVSTGTEQMEYQILSAQLLDSLSGGDSPRAWIVQRQKLDNPQFLESLLVSTKLFAVNLTVFDNAKTSIYLNEKDYNDFKPHAAFKQAYGRRFSLLEKTSGILVDDGASVHDGRAAISMLLVTK